MKSFEVNFDGLVGPTHNYAGLADGNLASSKHSQATSFPAKAALQGLEKMKLLHDLGLKQAILPPQQRPDFNALRKLGFSGSPRQMINKCSHAAPHLLAAVYSSSCMWTANCATISPSADTVDNRLHITPANLVTNLHRSIEGKASERILKALFSNEKFFTVNSPLPESEEYADEGAANHIRFSKNHGEQGIELFVYGKGRNLPLTGKFNARQNISASKALIRSHMLKPEATILARQSLQAIDSGVFHNDVISTGNENFFIVHENAFENQKEILRGLKDSFKQVCDNELYISEILSADLSLKEAVSTYLFNSQLITVDKQMILIAPKECEESPAVRQIITSLINSQNPLSAVKYVNLRQSMSNGGGPACLRLRIVMNENELEAMHQGVLFNDTLYEELKEWITKFYREELKPEDLADYQLVDEVREALDKLSQILKLNSIYPFQD